MSDWRRIYFQIFAVICGNGAYFCNWFVLILLLNFIYKSLFDFFVQYLSNFSCESFRFLLSY